MFTLNCKGKLLVVDNPIVMGIINTTPDSFYEGSRFASVDAILRHSEKMLREGASILDIGAQSTRPNSQRVSVEEELVRLIPGVSAIHQNFPESIISVDTYYSRVAIESVQAGASMINDISAGRMDDQMLTIVAGLDVPYICMHMQGDPDTMHLDPHYEDVTLEVLDFFIRRVGDCQQAGIRDIIIDPGFGFGKTIGHNLQLLKNLSVFNILDKPVLLGLSRKSTIYKTLGLTATEALNGTTVLNTIGLINGATILRVHDVKEAVEAIELFQAYKAS